MAFKRTYRKKKMSVAKAKGVVAKAKRTAGKSNKDTFSLKCRTEATILPQQGVSVSNYVYTTIPLFAQASDVGFYKNAQFQLYKKLYDQYRVNSVTMKIVPKANMLSQDMAQRDADFTTSGTGLVHSVIDRDGPASMNVQTLVRYPSYRKHSVMKPFSRTYGIKWPTEVWLTTNEAYPDQLAIVKQIGGLGGIYVYGEDLIEDRTEVFNEPWASLEVTYNIVFRGQISTNFGYDPMTDTITLAPLTINPLPVPTQLVHVKGSINDTSAYQTTDADPSIAQDGVDQSENVNPPT